MTDRFGIDDRYIDASGAERRVPASSVRRLAALIGEPEEAEPPVVVVRPDGAAGLGGGLLELEDGGEVALDGMLPNALPLGYHRQIRPDAPARQVICTPGRCHLEAGWRAWGFAAQLYATRSQESWGIGDLGDLARLGSWAAGSGAGFLLVNPLGAVAPSGPQQPSPYFPASRRFSNPLYLDVPQVPGATAVPEALGESARAGTELNGRRIIERDAVWRLKRSALEAIWTARPPLGEFTAWRKRQPPALEQFATWCALCDLHGPKWRDWPVAFARPDSAAVAAFAARESDRIAFFAWLQFCCARQLEAASGGLALIQDLPIGVDPNGFDAWSWQDVLALDAAVGAPPDEFNQQGQDWGLPPFVPWKLRATGYAPFIETIRAAIGAGGGLRIDHVMGLFRLWWIPSGGTPEAGAYVRYPAEDLLGIVALESARAGAVVVGEDLGTVEESARTLLAAHDVLSYRLLWFEEEAPRRWPRPAMAAVTTHDLPTVAGLWDGSDLETQRQLGLDPNEESTLAIRRRLARRGHLPKDATPADAVRSAYAQLGAAPSVLLGATLDDAVVESQRPNIPGADGKRPNWSLALPLALEEIEQHPVARQIATTLNAAVRTPLHEPHAARTPAPRPRTNKEGRHHA